MLSGLEVLLPVKDESVKCWLSYVDSCGGPPGVPGGPIFFQFSFFLTFHRVFELQLWKLQGDLLLLYS